MFGEIFYTQILAPALKEINEIMNTEFPCPFCGKKSEYVRIIEGEGNVVNCSEHGLGLAPIVDYE